MYDFGLSRTSGDVRGQFYEYTPLVSWRRSADAAIVSCIDMVLSKFASAAGAAVNLAIAFPDIQLMAAERDADVPQHLIINLAEQVHTDLIGPKASALANADFHSRFSLMP